MLLVRIQMQLGLSNFQNTDNPSEFKSTDCLFKLFKIISVIVLMFYWVAMLIFEVYSNCDYDMLYLV